VLINSLAMFCRSRSANTRRCYSGGALVWHIVLAIFLGLVIASGAHFKSSYSQEKEAHALLDQIMKLYREGRYSEAIPLAERRVVILQKNFGHARRTIDVFGARSRTSRRAAPMASWLQGTQPHTSWTAPKCNRDARYRFAALPPECELVRRRQRALFVPDRLAIFIAQILRPSLDQCQERR